MQNTKYRNSFLSVVEKMKSIDFHLPSELEAIKPPELRGLNRDDVKLMISYKSDNKVVHDNFYNIDRYLESGDLIVLNTSKTMNAAISAEDENGTKLKVHLSTALLSDLWIIEVRKVENNTTVPNKDNFSGKTLKLSGGGTVKIHKRYMYNSDELKQESERLCIGTFDLPCSLFEYLDKYGEPIRYSYVNEKYPLNFYQTVYADSFGSAEMPSAGRAFTFDIINKLVSKGVKIAKLILHTGVSSLEGNELPYEEYFEIPLETAKLINETRKNGKRIIAVGTTVVRALESSIDKEGNVHPAKGLTNILITPEKGIRSVNGMLTGLHEPRATHLSMLESLVGLKHLNITYSEALKQKYLWHEFGDLHLLLPDSGSNLT